MRVAAVMWCAAVPGLQVYLFRRIFDDLVKNHVEGPKGFRSMLAPWADAGLVTIVEKEIRFWNGSKIYLCHCQHDDDRFKYQGAEIHVLMVDELTHFSEVVYRFLRSRVRAPGLRPSAEFKGMFPRILCGSNPGNIGHQWVKATFVDAREPMAIEKMTDEEGGMFRQYIPAKLEDNPSMEEDDPGYDSRLGGLGSKELVRAMRDGDWNVVQGAYFSEFGPQHIIPPFEIPEHWTRFRSYDHGSAKPFSVGWWTVSDGTPVKVQGKERVFPAGALIRYREWYGKSAPNTGLKMDSTQIADGIKQRSNGESYAYSVADPAIFISQDGPCIAEKMALRGVVFREADNKRVAGWDALRARLNGHDDQPMIYFFSTCLDTLRTLPALQHDEAKPEDLDTEGEDHAADEVRYACMSRPYTRPKPPEKQPPKPLSKLTFNDLINSQPERGRARI